MKSCTVNLQKWTLNLQSASIPTTPRGFSGAWKYIMPPGCRGPNIWQGKENKLQQYRALKIGLTRPRRKELYARIDQRVRLMAEQGLLAEVEKLLAMGYDRELKINAVHRLSPYAEFSGWQLDMGADT